METYDIKQIKEIVASHKLEILEKVTKLVSYPSVMGEATSQYPFGKDVADCLHDALSMCEGYGFKTKNLDNYAGYGEIGSGDQVIGILGHLDVVPAGEGWTTDPFHAVIRDGKLYGRGTTDDKGAVVCGMVAMNIVKQLRPDLNKRIRLIMGCNEENGSNCLKYYVKQEGHVDYGFTPDGNFPGIHGEKGMVQGSFTAPTENILSIKGGVAGNVVPNRVELLVKHDRFEQPKFEEYAKQNKLTYSITNKDTGVLVIVQGVASHASLPHLGVNAISHAMMGLQYAGMKDTFVDFYARKIGMSYHGDHLNIHLKDDYGVLTFNIGVIAKTNDQITASIDIRFPIQLHVEDVVEPMSQAFEGEKAQLTIRGTHEPLFFEPDSPLVSMLSSAYYEVTKDHEHKVETIGGGTYAKGINNTIAFGCEFPNEDCHIHDADEFVVVDNLLLQTEIYVVALLKLLAA